MTSWNPAIGVTMVWLAVAGCKDPGGDPTGTGPHGSGTLAGPACEANAIVPAVLDCVFSSNAPGAGRVEYWLVDDPTVVRSTPVGPAGTQHAVSVLGLKAGRTYALQAVVDGTTHTSEVVTHEVPQVPPEFADLTLTARDPDRSEVAHGFVVVSVAHILNGRFTEVVILDGEGDHVWWVKSVDNGLSVTPTLSNDGRSIRFLTTDQTWATDLGFITRYAIDGSEVEETRALLGHHASVENSDGTLTWVSFEYETIDGKAWSADRLRTAPEGVGDDYTPTEEFSWFAAYPEDPWVDEPGTNDQVRYGVGTEWTHTNSLMAIDDDHFYLSAKNVDMVLKVRRSDGSIVWQLNGQYGDFTHPDGSAVWRSPYDLDLFSHSHMSHVWEGGMVVFDNGDLSHDPPYSRAVEYAFDETALTVEQVWEYVDPDLRFTGAMGDVRKLASGNYLIAWSGLERVDEVTPEGDVVWQIEMSKVGTFGRVLPIGDLYAPVLSVP